VNAISGGFLKIFIHRIVIR